MKDLFFLIVAYKFVMKHNISGIFWNELVSRAWQETVDYNTGIYLTEMWKSKNITQGQ